MISLLLLAMAPVLGQTHGFLAADINEPIVATNTAQPILLAKGPQLSLNQAAAQVQQQTGGRVLAANTEQRKGRFVHRIRVLLPNGVVRTMSIDAGPAN